MQDLINYYLGLTSEPYRTIQKRRQKVLQDQADDELIIRIFCNNWTMYVSRYAILAAGWVVALSIIVATFVMANSLVTALITTLFMISGLMILDVVTTLGIINRQLDALILTSKRLILRKYRRILNDRGDLISFDNLNDCIHHVPGIFASKIAKEGNLVLKLASGEQRDLKHIPNPAETVNTISRVREVHQSHGSQLTCQSLFSVPIPVQKPVKSTIIRDVVVAVRAAQQRSAPFLSLSA